MSLFRPALLIASLMSIGAAQSACTPVGIAAGAGATAGAAAMSEGGISGAVTDLQIKASINDLWFRSNMDIFRKLSLTVEEGRVLITGVVQNPEHRVEAVRLAWQARGVKQVINEIRVADSEGIQGYVSDTWISAQLRTKMTLDRDVQSINYSIDTVQGIVYLMGTARYPQELQRVTEIARAIPKVKQVVSYVRMRGEAVQAVTPGMAPAAPVAATPLSAPRTSTGTPPMSGDGVTVYDPATSTVLPNGGAGGSVTATPLPPN